MAEGDTSASTAVRPSVVRQGPCITEEGSDSTVTYDRLHGYKGALDVSKEISVNSKIPDQEARLGPVNHLCSGVKWFLRKHNGIRKENRDSYLCLYEIIHNDRPAVKVFTDLLLKGLVTGSGKLINT